MTKHVVLSDIIGAEDHFGDMDFKICGTSTGITGFQLDLKIQGLPMAIAKEAIYRNRELRAQILEVMRGTLETPRTELSPFAPRIQQIQIDSDKIGMLIGPGGKNIRRICEVSGAQIDINEDNSGRVNVYATSAESMNRALEEIGMLTAQIEEGRLYRGIVRGIKEFGAFVECLPGKEGLVHISELADFRVNRTEDVCAMGDEMWVKCVGIDEKGRVRLSRVAALAEREGEADDGIAAKVAAAKARGGSFSPREEGSDRPARRGGDRGDRGPRREGGERREGGDRGPRREGGDRGPRREGGDRGPRREGGDRGPRREGSEGRAPQAHSGGEASGETTYI